MKHHFRESLLAAAAILLICSPACRIIKGIDVAEGEQDAGASEMGAGADMSPALDMQRADEGTPAREEMGSDLAEMEACEPGEEICDGEDNDCNGQTDEGCDDDGDGYCDINLTQTDGAACDPGDCDDTRPDKNPGAKEPCPATEDLNCDNRVANFEPVIDPIQPVIARDALGVVSNVALREGADRSFGLFWIEERELQNRIRFQQLDASGAKVAPPVSLTGPDESALTFDVRWHEPSNSWILFWKISAAVGLVYDYRVALFDAQGNRRGQREYITTTDALHNPIFFFSQVQVAIAGEGVVLLHADNLDGEHAARATVFIPETREFGETMTLFSNHHLNNTSWASLPPESPETASTIHFKKTGAVNSSYEPDNDSASLKLTPTARLVRDNKFYGDSIHNDLVQITPDQLGLIRFAERDDTPEIPADKRLYIEKLKPTLNRDGDAVEIASDMSDLEYVLNLDEGKLGFVYRERLDIDSYNTWLVPFDIATFSPEPRVLLPFDTIYPEYYLRDLNYQPSTSSAAGQFYGFYTTNEPGLPKQQLAIFDLNNQELARHGYLDASDADYPTRYPNLNETRYLEGGGLEWLRRDTRTNPETGESEAYILHGRFDADGANKTRTLEPTFGVSDYCAPAFVGDEIVCTQERNRQQKSGNQTTGCSKEIITHRWARDGSNYSTMTATLPTLLTGAGTNSARCHYAHITRDTPSINEDGELVYIMQRPIAPVTEGYGTSGPEEVIVMRGGEAVTERVLLEDGIHRTPRIYEAGDRALIMWDGTSNITTDPPPRLAYQWASTSLIPEHDPRALDVPMARGDEEVSLSRSYPWVLGRWGENGWLFYGARVAQTFQVWAQNIPLESAKAPAPPILLGEYNYPTSESPNFYIVTQEEETFMMSVTFPDSSARTSRAHLIIFDAEMKAPRTRIESEPFISTSNVDFSYHLAAIPTAGEHHAVFVPDIDIQRMFLVDRDGEVASESAIPINSVTQVSNYPISPRGFHAWRDGETWRWPLWSNNNKRALMLELTCR